MNTIIAATTPFGYSAVAMLRISGEDSFTIASRLAPKVASLEHGTIRVTNIRDTENNIVDQVTMVAFHAPKSFTGEHVVEISCHGNPIIVEKIIHLSIQYGARLARPGEFTRQAVENAKMSMLQAEALHEVIHAASAEGILVAQAGLQGQVDAQELYLREELLNICAELEAKMDYPQEDLSFDTDEELANKLDELVQLAKESADSYIANKVKIHGAKVALLGPVNAGKSSLFNNLVGSKRAIVSNIPGTTRDIVERTILVDGLDIQFFDTAGTRFDTEDPIEAEGVQMGLDLVQDVDICLVVVPCMHTDVVLLDYLIAAISPTPYLVVATHADMDIIPIFEYDILVSNIDLSGIIEIKNKIRTMLGFTSSKSAKHVALNQRQQELFYRIAEHVHMAKDSLLGVLGPVVAAEEITQALECTAMLRGESAREMILDKIFEKFCIGK